MEKGIEIRYKVSMQNNKTGEKYDIEGSSTFDPAWPCFNPEYILGYLRGCVSEYVSEVITRLKSD